MTLSASLLREVLDKYLRKAQESDYAGDSTSIEVMNGELLFSIYEDNHEYRIYVNADGTWKAEIHNG